MTNPNLHGSKELIGLILIVVYEYRRQLQSHKLINVYQVKCWYKQIYWTRIKSTATFDIFCKKKKKCCIGVAFLCRCSDFVAKWGLGIHMVSHCLNGKTTKYIKVAKIR